MNLTAILQDIASVVAIASAICAALPKTLQAKLGPLPAILQTLALNVGHAAPTPTVAPASDTATKTD